jgi:hypothetical protein
VSSVVLTGTIEVNGVRVPVQMSLDVEEIRAALGDAEGRNEQAWAYGDRELAAHLHWPLGRVQKLSAAGMIPVVRLDGTQRKAYDLRAVDEWLRQHGGGAPMT